MTWQSPWFIPGPALAAAALASVVACGPVIPNAYITREERSFPVSGIPNVTLVTFDGTIEVRAWDRLEVRVEIERRGSTKEAAEAIAIVAEQTGQDVHVEARRPGGRRFGLSYFQNARLVASVPREVNLFARTGDGGLSIERISGRIELRTGDGSIVAIGVGGDVSAQTSDGSVKLQDVNGRVHATTGDGGITIAGRLESVRLRTADGSILLRADPGSRMIDDWDITTGDGGVTLYLPTDFDAQLDAVTSDGRIRTEQAVELEAGVRPERRRLSGSLGAGGRSLRIRTSDGSISLRTS